jgi:hypothetical protein
MNVVLAVYFILMPGHRWEFLIIEPTESQGFCEMESAQVDLMFKDLPGNMRVVCVDDLRIWI